MLFEFLIQHKNEIIQACKDKVLMAGESKPTSELLDRGLPVFYNELIGVLRYRAASAAGFKDTLSECRIREGDAASHGKESLRLGYTISQVVHAYGAVCQSITEYAQVKSFEITPREFHDLNLCLDFAIAEAVTEFEKVQNEDINRSEVERLGFFIHELGNSLAAASIAHTMIQEGRVANAGVTSHVLSRAHERMRHLIERSLAEVRLRGHAAVEQTQVLLIDVLREVETTSVITGKSREVHLELDVDPAILLTVDRHLFFSALSNLVNNAMKFTKKHGKVSVRGKESKGRILIEVEDECGGLPEGKTEELFEPFIQKGTDKTGLGLGLSLSRRAIELNQGKLTAHNISGKGCVFTIDLPQKEETVQPVGQKA